VIQQKTDELQRPRISPSSVPSSIPGEKKKQDRQPQQKGGGRGPSGEQPEAIRDSGLKERANQIITPGQTAPLAVPLRKESDLRLGGTIDTVLLDRVDADSLDTLKSKRDSLSIPKPRE